MSRKISSVLFLYLMGVWTGIVLIATELNYLAIPAMWFFSSVQVQNLAGFIGFASGALGILGFLIKNKWVQIASLALLAGFFMFVGVWLTFPVIRTGSNFLIIAVMCIWAAYRRI